MGYFEYDANGNRTFEGYTSKNGAWPFQQSVATYDQLNRLIRIQDPRCVIDYEYDAQGKIGASFVLYSPFPAPYFFRSPINTPRYRGNCAAHVECSWPI